MTTIEWRDDYDTGLQVLDDQHRQLVEILNSLEDAVRRGRDRASVDAILRDLIGYTQEHFGFEERVLAGSRHPDFADLQRRNREWIREIERFHYERLTAGRALTPEFRCALREWLQDHLARGDAKARGARSLTPPRS
jgi:hemerythrin